MFTEAIRQSEFFFSLVGFWLFFGGMIPSRQQTGASHLDYHLSAIVNMPVMAARSLCSCSLSVPTRMVVRQTLDSQTAILSCQTNQSTSMHSNTGNRIRQRKLCTGGPCPGKGSVSRESNARGGRTAGKQKIHARSIHCILIIRTNPIRNEKSTKDFFCSFRDDTIHIEKEDSLNKPNFFSMLILAALCRNTRSG
jgi:hypothetical protein